MIIIQTIVLLPRFKGLYKLEKIREKYDSGFIQFKPHITLVYPFEKDFSEEQLNQYINDCLKDFKPFRIRLKGLLRSPKKLCLYLLIDEGKDELIRLYETLHLKYIPEKKKEYVPHFTIGDFKSKEGMDKAVKEIDEMSLDFSFTLDSIFLLELDEEMIDINIKRYKL